MAAIEAGAAEWRMPWHTGADGEAAGLPINAGSGGPYRGINTLVLWATAHVEGYPSAVWGTYRQWAALGAQVRKGEKASPVVFWKIRDGEPEEETEESGGRRRARVFARGYSVFNAAQVDGYVAPPVPVLPEVERIEQAEAFFAATRHRGPAWRQPRLLCAARGPVQMPPFKSSAIPSPTTPSWRHETTHITSHPSRCERDLRAGLATRRMPPRNWSRSSARRSCARTWR